MTKSTKSRKLYAEFEHEFGEQLENLAFALETEAENIKVNWPTLRCTGVGESMMDSKSSLLWVLLYASAKWLHRKAKTLEEDGIEDAVGS